MSSRGWIPVSKAMSRRGRACGHVNAASRSAHRGWPGPLRGVREIGLHGRVAVEWTERACDARSRINRWEEPWRRRAGEYGPAKPQGQLQAGHIELPRSRKNQRPGPPTCPGRINGRSGTRPRRSKEANRPASAQHQGTRHLERRLTSGWPTRRGDIHPATQPHGHTRERSATLPRHPILR
jgi:hypothetical protein